MFKKPPNKLSIKKTNKKNNIQQPKPSRKKQLKWYEQDESLENWESNPPVKKTLFSRHILHRRTDLPYNWRKIEE